MQAADEKFIITNNRGSFALIAPAPTSRYEGVCWYKAPHMYKIIADIKLPEQATKVINQLWAVERQCGNINERWFMPDNRNALVYELSQCSEATLVLDCKRSDDNREWGRKYELAKEQGCLVIKFTKTNDSRDDNSHCRDEYTIFIAVHAPELEYLLLERWDRQEYGLDKQRQSQPFHRWVFNACKLKAKEIAFGFGSTKEEAIKTAKEVFAAKEKIMAEKEKRISEQIHGKHPKETQEYIAYQCAIASLNSLSINNETFAGLPWFYQPWARDELISTGALIELGETEKAKQTIMRYLEQITPDGKIHSNPQSSIAAADAPGWLFLRAEKMLELFNKQGKNRILGKLMQILDSWQKKSNNGLLKTGAKETWMDTQWNDNGREGYCIEIQALALAMCRLYKKLTGKEHSWKEKLKTATVQEFWNGTRLKDSANETTVRPNAFIAAYAYPELLSKKDWTKCFKSVLPRIWLGWGGIATIDTSHKLFTPEYTGENNKSYHRGDSWFWINNLAALVMQRIDSTTFNNHILKIIEASSTELLYLGATGHHAELSSASKLESCGCLSQAWSSAMFIELMNEKWS